MSRANSVFIVEDVINCLPSFVFIASQVCRLKLLDNDKRLTNLAFIEFAEVRNSLKSSSIWQ